MAGARQLSWLIRGEDPDFSEEAAKEVRSAVEWAQVRALAADGLSQRQIAARLGINRRTVARLAAAVEPPRYSRSP